MIDIGGVMIPWLIYGYIKFSLSFRSYLRRYHFRYIHFHSHNSFEHFVSEFLCYNSSHDSYSQSIDFPSQQIVFSIQRSSGTILRDDDLNQRFIRGLINQNEPFNARRSLYGALRRSADYRNRLVGPHRPSMSLETFLFIGISNFVARFLLRSRPMIRAPS